MLLCFEQLEVFNALKILGELDTLSIVLLRDMM